MDYNLLYSDWDDGDVSWSPCYIDAPEKRGLVGMLRKVNPFL